QPEPKIHKDYKTEYKKMKGKLAILEASPSTSQNPKTSQSKNKGLVLMALADDELTMGNNHTRNGEWINITMRKVNILLYMDEDADWENYLKYINVVLNEQIPNQKKKIIGGDVLTESSSKKDVNKNLFILASMVYDHKMVLKSKDWVERHNPNSKLPNFNTGKILVPQSQAVNECLKPTEASNNPESSKDSES
ncbi:hypothetical protein Tco_1299085, partial [Tanacetum coccineum]